MAERETKSVKLSQLSLQQMDRFKGQLNDVSKLHVMSVNNPLRQKIVYNYYCDSVLINANHFLSM